MHRVGERAAALLQGFDEAACFLHPFAQVEDAFAFRARQALEVATFIALQEREVVIADAQGRHMSAVEGHRELAVGVGIYDEVGRDLL